MAQDAFKIKEKIISYIRTRGPSLPVHLAKETDQSILFASAFLSELLSEKTLKISNLKVGSSPIYFIPGQEPQLERFSQHLKNKEKEAFLLLKEKKFLADKDQYPAIRVALRELRDFAIPFKNNGEIYWKYFTTPESEFTPEAITQTPKEVLTQRIPESPQQELEIREPQKEEPETQEVQKEEIGREEPKEKLNIFNGPKEKEPEPIKPQKKLKTKPKLNKKIAKRKTVSSDKKNEKFFNDVKEFLAKKKIEITDIVGFSKTDLTLKIENDGEKLLVAFSKKRIEEKDILEAHKKAQEKDLPYMILSLGEPSKRIKEFIEAIKALDSLEKIE